MDPYGQTVAHELYEYDLAGNRTKKALLDGTGSPLLTLNNTLATGNRLVSWSVAETDLVGQVDVAGASSEAIGTNDRFGWLYVSNLTSGTSIKPYTSGTNFWAYDLTVGLGTQKVVAAIRDQAGNTTHVTNQVFLTVVTNGAYQCSAAGCVTNIAYRGKDYTSTIGLTWDGQYQMVAVATNGTVAERHGYDAVGRRLWTWDAANGTNWMVYDGGQVVADVNATGGLVRSYVWGPGIDNLLAMTTYGGTTSMYYAVKDNLKSVLALVNSLGQIVEQYRYDAWGRTTVFDASGNPLAASAVGNRYCWQGREYSFRIGLYCFRARWADPITGRWLSNDPIGISGGLNQYVFCANNPVNMTDASGLKWGAIDPKSRDMFNAASQLSTGQAMIEKITASSQTVAIEPSPDDVNHWVRKGENAWAIQLVDKSGLYALGHEMQHALEGLYPNSLDPANLSVDADDCPQKYKAEGTFYERRAVRAGNRLFGEWYLRHFGNLPGPIDWYRNRKTGEDDRGIPRPFGTTPLLGRPVP
jgi:RHS repeat-associated protein